MEGKQVSYVITSFYSVYPAEWGVRDSLARRMGMLWEEMRSPVVVPMLKVMVMVCLAMSVMLFVERVYMAVVMLLMKMTGFKPQNKWKWEPIPQKDPRGHHHNDLELGTSSSFPMVLVQIPMRNEKEVYQLSITAACKLSWPADRLIVQVLDDSTDPLIKELVEGECKKWAMKGVNVKYVTRENRKGHKAGNLREGMKHSYVKLCDYVAIFDADFEPEPDFLKRTVPFLVHNPEIALVQARWTYVNADECMLTRMQEMSLDYHFAVEQEVGSSTYSFFGFNGTAGVWRISALNDAGGWKDRSTVEDMDLAVRASLRGWKFVYAGDVKVKSELPSTFKAYRNQQRRWSCGPAYLFRQTIVEILRNTKVCAWKKFYVIYSFFFVRKIIAHVVTFVFYCLLLPATVLIPEVQIPRWGAVYLPSIVTLLNAVGTPRSLHLLVFSILFENVTAMDRAKATLSGLLELGRVNEWIVTEKLGATLKNKSAKKVATKFRTRVGERFHLSEFLVGAYLFVAAWYDLWHGSNHYFVFLFLQSFTFIILSFNYVGIIVPNS